ncbi:photosystem I subunit O [Juglans regia]|uniref:Photosystem I subunit O n=1 Tax=Juglans regia TaxID=51240 RepID=A0A2I4GXZ5_JUGRE|nr:photosystem I subunit O [Juglans regia]
MAATFATSSTIIGLGTSSLASPSRASVGKRSSCLTSGFVKSSVAVRNPLSQAGASGGKFTCFERNWLRTDFNVIGFGLIGWLAPSSIPAIDGKSLTGLFFESIGAELSHFPTPPALTSQFWLWLVTWHLGLFIVLTFGQIGFKGRTEDYF